MKKYLITTIIATISILHCMAAIAQEKTVVAPSKNLLNNYLDFGIGLKKSETLITAGYYKNWQLSKSKRIIKNIYVGTGLRFMGFGATNIYFTSAIPSLYGTPDEDSILAPKPSMYSLNTFVNFGYQVHKRVQIGFDLDAFGVSFGPNGSPTYIADGANKTVKVKPTPVNALLVGANDRGTLDGGLYLRAIVNKRIGASVRYHTLFTEIKTDEVQQTVPEINTRFRHGSNLIGLSISYSL